MQTNQIEDLLKRYARGQCTDQEKALVENTYLSYLPNFTPLSEKEIENDLALIKARLPKKKTSSNINIFRFAAAAAILVLVSSAVIYYGTTSRIQKISKIKAKEEQILPGTDKAILTLANGEKVILDKNDTTLLADAGLKIRKTAAGELIYEVINTGADQKNSLAYNTIETPRGGQYKVILPDGTSVWLNAASSLRYPMAFSGKNRMVTLTGEGYFEVAKNKEMPFLVMSGNQTVEVLGTHFNISAYADEPNIHTTLLEGKVAVRRGREKVEIAPGQQVINKPQSSLTAVELEDANEKIAWKNGLFLFRHENIKSIMNKISRWYDIEVAYNGDFGQQYYSGTISKFENVADVLKIMELTRSVKFNIEGRRIEVTK